MNKLRTPVSLNLFERKSQSETLRKKVIDLLSRTRDKEGRQKTELFNRLKLKKSFGSHGSQGLAGILEMENGETIVFKLSNEINYLIQHEALVQKTLNPLREFCPHFCLFFDQTQCWIDDRYDGRGDPFHPRKLGVVQDVLLVEHLPGSISLTSQISRLRRQELYACIKQVLLALEMAQRTVKLTHYDLHTDNILLTPCERDAVFLYVLSPKEVYLVPTYGVVPVIIDFGFAYVQGIEGHPLYATMTQTDSGYLSVDFDPITDTKVFLMGISYDMKEGRKKEEGFRSLIREVFQHLKIELRTGWDNHRSASVGDLAKMAFKDCQPLSRPLKKHPRSALNLFQSLFSPPFQNRKNSEVKQPFLAIDHQLRLLLDESYDAWYDIYLLRGVVESARTVRADYCSGHPPQMRKAIVEFSRGIFNYFQEVIPFFDPSDEIDYEDLLRNLFLLAERLETFYYHAYTEVLTEKKRDYQKVPISGPLAMYQRLDQEFANRWTLERSTVVYVWDLSRRKAVRLAGSHPEWLVKEVNRTLSAKKGRLLYRHYFEK